MMDLVSVAAGLSHAINIAKTVRDADKQLDRATLKAQMAEVMDKATDAKFALSDAREEIVQKDREIERLKAAFEERTTLTIGEGDYKFRSDGEGNKLGYPMCPRCDAVDRRIVQVMQDGDWLTAKCPVCASKYSPVACYISAESGQGTETREIQYDRAVEAQRRRDDAILNRSDPWGRV